MSKYIIDLRPDCKVVQQICAIDKGINIGSRSIGLLDELTDDYVKKNFKDLLEGEYQRGLEEGKKATFGLVADASNAEYQKGLNDAWECARKIVYDDTCGGMSMKELVEIFNKSSDAYIIRDYTAQQAIEKIKAYEKKQADKIEVGDEVKSLNDSGVEIEGLLPWVVTTVDQGDYCQGIDSKGEVHATKKVRACKTGRHFDIKGILEEMKA